uniref:RNase III domain-containing protein n=1 Tax=Aegilops tauschii subsp. strangulata TaxID=200361 RepID=A0A453T619_AEGTS
QGGGGGPRGAASPVPVQQALPARGGAHPPVLRRGLVPEARVRRGRGARPRLLQLPLPHQPHSRPRRALHATGRQHLHREAGPRRRAPRPLPAAPTQLSSPRSLGQFIQSVKQELEDDLGTTPYGGTVFKAPKVLADIVEAIAAAVYVDCNFNLEKLWKVTRFLFEPIVTAETIDEQPVSTLHELCQKHGKDVKFKTWQKGGTVVVNVFVGGALVGMGSSEQMVIAKLNATRDALSKLLGGGNQQVLTTGVGHGLGVEVGELRECKQKLIEQCSRKHWPKPIFKLEKEEGLAHDRTFVYSVQVETQGGIWVTLSDKMSRVKDAENSGAQKMLEHLLKL